MSNKWGTYPWFIEHGINLIYPDDLEAFKREVNNCKVFECIDEGNYLTLKYNNRFYRVREKLFKPVPMPKFNFGQKVKIKDKDEIAIITDIMWHFGNTKHFYMVTVNGKKKSKRYYEFELEQ